MTVYRRVLFTQYWDKSKRATPDGQTTWLFMRVFCTLNRHSAQPREFTDLLFNSSIVCQTNVETRDHMYSGSAITAFPERLGCM